MLMIVSSTIVLTSFIMISMLQRSASLGDLIMMVKVMVEELGKFILTFGVVIGAFIIVGTILKLELYNEQNLEFLDLFLYIF